MTLVSLTLALALAQAPAAEQPAPEPPAGPVLSLDDALSAAAERNLDFKILDAQLRQADELSWKAWSGYLPQVTASGTYTRNEQASAISLPVGFTVRERTGGPGTPGNPDVPPGLPGLDSPYFAVPSQVISATLQEQNALAGQLEVNQVLFAPQLWFAIRGAGRGERAAELNVENGRREVLFGVARSYYAVASLRQALGVQERLLEIARRQERDARVRYEAGAVAKVALLRAEIERARAEQDVKRARNAYQSAKIGLATLLDRDVAFEVADPPEPALPADLQALEEQAVRERPDVQAARAQVEAQRATRAGHVARYLPTVAGFYRYQLANSGGFTGEEGTWAAGLALQWKLLDGGLRESDVREAGARVAELEAREAAAASRARLEVRQALLDLDSARANAEKAREQRELAAENQRLVDVAFRAGTATAVEQADATTQLRNAEVAVVAETLNAQLAAVQVLKVAGVFRPHGR